MAKEDEEVLDRGDEFDPTDEELDELEDQDNVEYESSVEDDEEEYEDEDEDQEDAEDDEDEDEDEDEEDEEEPEEERIPRSRLNQVIKQRNEERERTKWLEQQLEKVLNSQTAPKKEEAPQAPAEPPYNYEEKEAQYIELILDGETAKAIKLRSEIDAARAKDFQKMLAEQSETTMSQTSKKLEDERFNDLVSAFEEEYSFLDASSDDYNEEAVETINRLMGGYMAEGTSREKALALAVDKMLPFYTKAPAKEALGTKKKSEKATADKKRNAKASRQQPPRSPGRKTRDVDPSALRPSTLSEKQFNQLSDREKRILRGD